MPWGHTFLRLNVCNPEKTHPKVLRRHVFTAVNYFMEKAHVLVITHTAC